MAVAEPQTQAGRGSISGGSKNNQRENSAPVQHRPRSDHLGAKPSPPELIGSRKRIPGRGEDYKYFPGWPEDQHPRRVLVVASWPSWQVRLRFASGRGFESRGWQNFASFPTPARNSTFWHNYPHSKVKVPQRGTAQGWWRRGGQREGVWR